MRHEPGVWAVEGAVPQGQAGFYQHASVDPGAVGWHAPHAGRYRLMGAGEVYRAVARLVPGPGGGRA